LPEATCRVLAVASAHYGKNASEARYDEWGEATRLLAKLKAAKLAADKKMLAMYEA